MTGAATVVIAVVAATPTHVYANSSVIQNVQADAIPDVTPATVAPASTQTSTTAVSTTTATKVATSTAAASSTLGDTPFRFGYRLSSAARR